MSIRASANRISARKRAFDAAVKGLAWYVGWLGMLLLPVCGVLWLVAADTPQLPIYTMIAMLLASFVGWLYVNKGQDRIKKHLGRTLNILLFLILTTGCLVAGIAEDWLAEATGWQPPDHPFWLFVRWYPIVLVIVCACVFLLWKAKPRKRVYIDRGLGYALLFAPYALLFAYLSLGVHMDWINESLHGTLGAMGRYAIVAQLLMAFFIGGD